MATPLTHHNVNDQVRPNRDVIMSLNRMRRKG